MRVVVFLGVVALIASPVWGTNVLQNSAFSSGMTGWSTDNISWGNIGNGAPDTWNCPGGPSGPSANGDPVFRRQGGMNVHGVNFIYQVVSGLAPNTSYDLAGEYYGFIGAHGAIGGSKNMPSGSWATMGVGGYPGGYVNANCNLANLKFGVLKEIFDGTVETFTTNTFRSGTGQVSTDGSGKLTIYARYGAYQADWQVFCAEFDNITLTPEPTSLILLALGLPMLRRRR